MISSNSLHGGTTVEFMGGLKHQDGFQLLLGELVRSFNQLTGILMTSFVVCALEKIYKARLSMLRELQVR